MTNTASPPAPTSIRPSHDRWRGRTAVTAALSGAALVLDTVTITVLNRAFDPLDSALFLCGLAGMLLATGSLAMHLSRHRSGGPRAVTAVTAYLACLAVLGAVSAGFDAFGRHTFSPSNRGLHGEWSFFSIGLALLALSGWAAAGARARDAAA